MALLLNSIQFFNATTLPQSRYSDSIAQSEVITHQDVDPVENEYESQTVDWMLETGKVYQIRR